MSTTRRGWWKLAGAVAWAAAGGLASCQADISPQPEPPVRQDPFDVDFGEMEAKADSFSNEPPGLRGGPGSVQPAGATLRVINLDRGDAPVDTIIDNDGSFEALISVTIGEEVRLQIFSDQARSKPFDGLVEADEAPPIPVVRPLDGCLKLTPALELTLAQGTGTVRVDNDCAEPVVLAAPYLRRSVSGLTAGEDATWPATLAPGDSVSIAVNTDGTTPKPLSEIVFLEATAPERDRRPVTIWSED